LIYDNGSGLEKYLKIDQESREEKVIMRLLKEALASKKFDSESCQEHLRLAVSHLESRKVLEMFYSSE
jgi:hypothetical protein